MKKEDYDRIAKEFGDSSQEKKAEKKTENIIVGEQPEKPKPRQKQEEEPVKVKISNGFLFGILIALGFWLVTAIIAGLAYVVALTAGYI